MEGGEDSELGPPGRGRGLLRCEEGPRVWGVSPAMVVLAWEGPRAAEEERLRELPRGSRPWLRQRPGPGCSARALGSHLHLQACPGLSFQPGRKARAVTSDHLDDGGNGQADRLSRDPPAPAREAAAGGRAFPQAGAASGPAGTEVPCSCRADRATPS